MNRSVAALYRKYRPQTFAEVVGPAEVVRTVRKPTASGQDRTGHTVAGPRVPSQARVRRFGSPASPFPAQIETTLRAAEFLALALDTRGERNRGHRLQPDAEVIGAAVGRSRGAAARGGPTGGGQRAAP